MALLYYWIEMVVPPLSTVLGISRGHELWDASPLQAQLLYQLNQSHVFYRCPGLLTLHVWLATLIIVLIGILSSCRFVLKALKQAWIWQVRCIFGIFICSVFLSFWLINFYWTSCHVAELFFQKLIEIRFDALFLFHQLWLLLLGNVVLLSLRFGWTVVALVALPAFPGLLTAIVRLHFFANLHRLTFKFLVIIYKFVNRNNSWRNRISLTKLITSQ